MFKTVGEGVRWATQALEEMGVRKPEWRVFKSELPQCGAKTRAGRPCRAKAAWDEYRCAPQNGRCRLHGGWSTGPRTEEGLLRVAEAARQAQLRRWEAYRQRKEERAALLIPKKRGRPKKTGRDKNGKVLPSLIAAEPELVAQLALAGDSVLLVKALEHFYGPSSHPAKLALQEERALLAEAKHKLALARNAQKKPR